MPNKTITLFAVHPIKVNGERVHEQNFEVATQKHADELIACGAAALPKSDFEADVTDEAAAAERQKIEETKKTQAQKEADDKAAEAKANEGKAADGKASNVVTLKQPPESPEDRLAAIKVATIDLQKENDAEKFTSQNGPTVDALTAVLGWKANAGERNQIWLSIQAASGSTE